VESISVSNSENEMGTPKERTTGWELYYWTMNSEVSTQKSGIESPQGFLLHSGSFLSLTSYKYKL
jgi:hypothetical protein